jgi:hypothetical protein
MSTCQTVPWDMKGLSVCIAKLIYGFQINPFRQRNRAGKIIQECRVSCLLATMYYWSP